MDEGIPEQPGSGKEEKTPEASIVGSVLPLTQAVTFGGISGFCSGFVLKKLGKAAAATFGTLFVLSQVLFAFLVLQVLSCVLKSGLSGLLISSTGCCVFWLRVCELAED